MSDKSNYCKDYIIHKYTIGGPNDSLNPGQECSSGNVATNVLIRLLNLQVLIMNSH